MKIKQIKFFVIFFSFAISYTFSTNITKQGFNEIVLQTGKTELNYNFPLNLTDEDRKCYYIFFSFSEDNITYYIKDLNDSTPIGFQKDEWEFFPLIKLGNNLDSITFIINNPNLDTAKMIFIDSSQEINLTITEFLNWSYDIKIKIEEDFPPSPLIFSIDKFTKKDETTIHFKNDDYEIFDDQNLIYYCINEGTNCQYKTISALKLEKNNEYKIKLNWFKKNKDPSNFYTFYPEFNKIIITEDVIIGSNSWDLKKDIKEYYYFIKTKDIDNIYIFVKYSGDNYEYKFINESQKESIYDDLNSINFDKNNTNLLSEYNNAKNYDYLIIKIESIVTEIKPFSINAFYNLTNIDEPESIVFKKGTHTLIRISNMHYNNKYKLTSNYTLIVFDENFNFVDYTVILLIGEDQSLYAYAYNEDEDILVEYSMYNPDEKEEEDKEEEHIIEDYKWKIDIINKDNLSNYFDKFGEDFYFARTFSYSDEIGFYFSYFSNIEKKYHLYNKIYFGNGEIYQNITNIESYVKNKDFNELIHFFGSNDFKLINNEEITITGNKLLTYYNSYGTLYDLFMQKEEDSEIINKNNNFVKLFIEGKNYTLNFALDHYIKLDSKYEEAEVIFTHNGKEYKLDKDNRVIKDLSGEAITVKSTKKNALVYFYKKLKEQNKILVLEFKKENYGQNMKFSLTHSNNNGQITIVKDFGFIECYPMIKGTETIKLLGNESIIYIENLYDKIAKEDLYEKDGEQYLIYLYDSLDEENLPTFNNNSNITIQEPIYYPNLLTKENKYNFEVIPQYSNGSIILNAINKKKAKYRFYNCSGLDIHFNLKNTSGDIYNESFNGITMLDFDLNNKNNILEHSFYSNEEFLFLYSFLNPKIEPLCKKMINHNKELTIIESPKNRIHIKFNQQYINCLNQYHIIITGANEDKLDDFCHIGKLMTQNSNSIVVKTIFENSEKESIITSIDISKLNIQQNPIAINVINYNVLSYNDLSLYQPKEFTLGNSEEIEFELEQKVKFDFDKRSQFKYNYTQENNTPLIVYFIFESVYAFNFMVINDDNSTDYSINDENNTVKLILKKSGVYYFKFHSNNDQYDGGEQEKYFTTYISDKVIYTTDLSEKIYYNNEQIFSRKDLGPRIIKVHNLEEEKYVLLSYKVLSEDNKNDEKDDYENPFLICKNGENWAECTEPIEFFTFAPKNNYTIEIHFTKNNRYNNRYCNPTFTISQIYNDSFVKNGEAGLYNISDIKLFNFDLENKDSLYLSVLNDKATYICYENEKIELSNLDKFSFRLVKIKSKIKPIYTSNKKFGIVIIVPENNNIETKAIIADKSITQKKEMKIDILIYFTILL